MLVPILPALGVAVADAVPVFDAVCPPAVSLPELEVVDVSNVLAADVTGGNEEVTDCGPGPKAERLLLASAEGTLAGNVTSADAVRGTSKMLQICASAWNVVSCAVLLQLLTTHGLKLRSTHVLAHRHGQFEAVQLLPLTFMHGRAQSVTSSPPAVTRREVMARVERMKWEKCIVAE